ncbi:MULTISPECIES: D-aminoacyl-tRNA deacylase [Clostridium]|uniref:D-aminoacyl-tRNA deacylase n=1 Tax=Clostridium cibarium TaxID=2762247 RepID=A0ABR8PTL5_9CLOT|nr:MULTISPECIES: D-aminoacyl-tRNA deacylase [Clostridium]MBD7911506.1 D-tyrosyl-tRNA(Tyr) deacylase [Clostridium cibarium]
MRAIVQRVNSSRVTVNEEIIGEISKGFNVLIGISKDDNEDDIKYISEKILGLRVFEDEDDKMNLSIQDVKGELLIISQFTLYGDCRKGRRPNFMNAMGGDEARELYEKLLDTFKKSGLKVECGEFGAHMIVDIVNDGPVTIMLDSKKEF